MTLLIMNCDTFDLNYDKMMNYLIGIVHPEKLLMEAESDSDYEL